MIAEQALTIDDEFKALIPPLTKEEYAQLEANILEEGCRDALVVWDGVLVDGHNRYEICTKHGLPFDVVDKEFADREAVKDWMDANQLGRRNLTPEAVSLLRGRRYNRVKVSGFKGNQHTLGNPHFEDKQKTSVSLAEQYGVSHATIERDGQFADAVEALKPTVPDIEQRVLSGDVPSKKAVVEASKEPEKAEEILRKPHVSNNSGDNEWYTPERFVECARQAMGSIDLDPASCEIANQIVKAKRFYTTDDDGLVQKWAGNVWMNPPYAQPLVTQFSARVVDAYVNGEITQACVLVNNATETGWFQNMARVATAICFPKGRVKFWHPRKEAFPLQGQAILYLGNNTKSFCSSYSDFGEVYVNAKL